MDAHGLHDHLVARGVRDDCHTTLVHSLSSPVPPSPPTAEAVLAAFAERRPRAAYNAPSLELWADKQAFGASRIARWFGR